MEMSVEGWEMGATMEPRGIAIGRDAFQSNVTAIWSEVRLLSDFRKYTLVK